MLIAALNEFVKYHCRLWVNFSLIRMPLILLLFYSCPRVKFALASIECWTFAQHADND